MAYNSKFKPETMESGFKKGHQRENTPLTWTFTAREFRNTRTVGGNHSTFAEPLYTEKTLPFNWVWKILFTTAYYKVSFSSCKCTMTVMMMTVLMMLTTACIIFTSLICIDFCLTCLYLIPFFFCLISFIFSLFLVCFNFLIQCFCTIMY